MLNPMNHHLRRVGHLNALFGMLGVGLQGWVWVLSAPMWADVESLGMSTVSMTSVDVLFGVALVVSFSQFMAGLLLTRGSAWSVSVLRLVSVIGLFAPPVGTALGAYSLWVLREHVPATVGSAASAGS